MESTGFLINKVIFMVNRDSFLNHHNHIYIARDDRQRVEAYEVNLEYKIEDIVSTLGEFFEREILINSNKLDIKHFSGISMLDNKVIRIPSEKFVFNNEFVDSCGMASHVSSNKLIETAFLEFIERQSYILNYLSKSPGIKIDIHSSCDCSKYDRYIKNFVDNIDYYNISLDEGVYVILSIATGKYKKAIGLGTNYYIEDAIIKSQKEILQNFAVDCSKYNHEDIGFYNEFKIERDIYHENFSNLSPENIKELYSYLSDSSKHIKKVDNHTKNDNISEIVERIYLNYGIEPFIVSINSNRDVNYLKVAKIIDLNWFPHMKPDHYSDNVYTYIETKTGLSLDRNIETLPFP